MGFWGLCNNSWYCITPSSQPPGGLCDLGCCCFLHGGFLFSGYFSMPLALHLSFSGPWRPPPALNSILATSGCLLLLGLSVTSLSRFTASSMVLSGLFLPPCTASQHFSACLTQVQAEKPKPGFFSILALTKLSLPARAQPWTIIDVVVTIPLFYQLLY